MRLVVWNSQGGRWPSLWNDWLNPFVNPGGPNPFYEDVVGLVVEAGWAPWVRPGRVRLNAQYFLNSSMTYHDATSANADPLSTALMASRRWKAMWIPWVRRPADFNVRTNTRCSMAAVACLRQLSLTGMDRVIAQGHLRPVVRVGIGVGRNTYLTIFCVHLTSGYWRVAQNQLNFLTGQMSQWIPQGSLALIVGDMNIPGPVPAAPQGWRTLDANPAAGTQKSGRDLDWGLLFDPRNTFTTAQISVVQQWETGNNLSDHSVMSYVLRD